MSLLLCPCSLLQKALWIVHARAQGRQHRVEMFYTARPEESYVDAAVATVLQVHADEAAGDILVFLTGQEEIEAVQRLLLDRYMISSRHACTGCAIPSCAGGAGTCTMCCCTEAQADMPCKGGLVTAIILRYMLAAYPSRHFRQYRHIEVPLHSLNTE